MAPVNSTVLNIQEPRIHITSRGKNGWAVVSQGARRATRVFAQQQQAIQFAKQSLTMFGPYEIIVHNSDGTFKQLIRAKGGIRNRNFIRANKG